MPKKKRSRKKPWIPASTVWLRTVLGGITQKALADRLGVSKACVNRWERGTRTPTRKMRAVLAKMGSGSV